MEEAMEAVRGSGRLGATQAASVVTVPPVAALAAAVKAAATVESMAAVAVDCRVGEATAEVVATVATGPWEVAGRMARNIARHQRTRPGSGRGGCIFDLPCRCPTPR